MGLIVKFPMECCPFGQQTNIGTILQSAIFLSGFFYNFSQRSNTFVLSLQYQLLNELIWLILT